jgi:hypothetical protein
VAVVVYLVAAVDLLVVVALAEVGNFDQIQMFLNIS